MSYLLKNKPKNENRGWIILIIILFLSLSVLVYLFPNAIRRVSLAVTKPVWFAGSFVTNSFSGFNNFFVSKNRLVVQNQALHDQITALNLKVVDYDVITKENEDLKSSLGRAGQNKHIVASILSRPPTSPYDSLVIDVGSTEGVLLGSSVYLSDTVVVGQITNVTPHTSLVSLFSTGGRKQESMLLRTGTSFVIVGSGGGNFKLEVPKDADILWGDSFMYPGLSASLLANVYYIDTNTQSSFKTVYLRIPGNVFSAKYLFVE